MSLFFWGLLFVLAAVGLFDELGHIMVKSRIGAGSGDALLYWSATHLFSHEQNPYDLKAITTAAQSVVPEVGEGGGVWNPPVIFSVIGWIGLFPFHRAAILLAIANLAIIWFGYILVLSSTRPESRKLRQRLLILYIIFPFIWNTVAMGQIAAFPQLALALGVYFMSHERGLHRSLSGGLCLSIGCIKPQVMLLPCLVLFFQSIREKSFRALLGFVAGCAILLACALVINASATTYYFFTPPLPFDLVCPTLGSWAYFFWTDQRAVARYVPITLAALVFGVAAMRQRSVDSDIRLFALSMAVGMAASPFGWYFDFSCMLPGIAIFLILLLREKRSSALVMLAVYALLCVVGMIWQDPNYVLVWFPPSIALWEVFAWRLTRSKAFLENGA